MSELREPSQKLRCHGCDDMLERSQFYETNISHGKYRCKACVCRGGAEYRAAHPARDILWHLHRHEKACGLTVGDVEALLGRFGGECFATGEAVPLAVVRARPDRPYGVDNTVLVGRDIAKRYREKGLPTTALARFDAIVAAQQQPAEGATSSGEPESSNDDTDDDQDGGTTGGGGGPAPGPLAAALRRVATARPES